MEDQIDNEFIEEQDQNHRELLECDICQRKFHPERIERHQIVCQKAKEKDQERNKIIEKKKKIIQEKNQYTEQVKQNSNWREEHQRFQELVQYNKKIKLLENKGEDISNIKVPESKINSNYIYCEYCERYFDQHVAERHIPKCKEIKAKPKPPKRKQNEIIKEKKIEIIPLIPEKRSTQISTPSTSSQVDRQPKRKPLSDSSQQFRPTSLQKLITDQQGKANLTNIGFVDCKQRATAIQDTECPHCNRKFISRAAERHIPICEKLTLKNSFQLKYRKSVPLKQNNLIITPQLLPLIQKKTSKIIDGLPPINNVAKFCTECGFRIQISHKFCGGCGQKRDI